MWAQTIVSFHIKTICFAYEKLQVYLNPHCSFAAPLCYICFDFEGNYPEFIRSRVLVPLLIYIVILNFDLGKALWFCLTKTRNTQSIG